MTENTPALLQAVADEQARQVEKWGEQNHPDISLYLPKDTDPERVAQSSDRIRESYARSAEDTKRTNDRIVEADQILGWDTILLEEVYEALEEADPEKLIVELIQVAAVALSYVEAIERRTK